MLKKFLYLSWFLGAAFKTSAQPAPLKKFRFEPSETKTLPGNSGEKGRGHNCSGDIKAEDQLGDFAVVSLFFQNACYTDGKYSHKNYKVESGVAVADDGTTKYPAVRIHPPAQRAAKFLASNHVGYYRSGEDLDIFALEAGMLAKVGRTSAATGGYRKAEVINLSRVDQPRIFAFIPQAQAFSPYQKIGAGSEAARIFEDATFSVDKYRIPVTGKIFNTARDFDFGPETHQAIYGQNRTFYVSPAANGLAVIWQDRANQEIYLSQIDAAFAAPRQQKLASLTGHLLAAATADDTGNLYYLLIEKGEKSGSAASRRVVAFKAGADGKSLKQATLDASANGLNITAFGDNYICSMKYAGGKLGVIVSRTMHRSGDGLNHQGAIAVVLDAATLALVKNLGQTSGHSFGNAMTVDRDNMFLAIDLGDNYPRGVHLHRFGAQRREGKIVYTFKTEHGTSARSPAGRTYPAYTEISGGGKTFYKWSNDNHTYSEIGGVHELADGIAVFFTGEPDSTGKALNNARTGANHNDARNLGMVVVKRDFASGDHVISKGVNEKGGFYSFGGTFSEQENRGIIWLTGYKDKAKHNASRVKTAALEGGRILIIHEIWTNIGYSSTQLTVMQPATGQIMQTVNLGPILQLGWRDDLLVKDGKVYAVSGHGVDGTLEIAVISVR